MPFVFDSSAPAAAHKIYDKAVATAKAAGMPPDKAHAKAVRMTQLAGWRKGQKGWKKVHPDIREKVNISHAVQQPDGRYMIENVPVFYPNAVKKGLSFTAEDIREMIANTNRGIANGGQKPGLIEGHTNVFQQAAGVQPDVHGAGVNWKEHKTKPGWAVCDLVDVEPEYVTRLQTNRLTGLSALIANDADGTNKRFGHVALLGGSPQALTHLPATEVFGASGQIAFSADTHDFLHKRTIMPGKELSEKAKAAFGALSQAYEAYGAAEASLKAGEPEAEKKMESAYAGYSKAYAAFSKETGEEFPPPTPSEELPKEHGEPELQNEPVFENAEMGSTERAHVGKEGEPVCQEGDTESESDTAIGTSPAPEFSADGLPNQAAFEADPAGAFTRVVGVVERLTAANKRYETQLNIEKGKRARAAYDAEIETLRKGGRTIPKEMADHSFNLCFSAAEPEKAIKATLAVFAKLPAAQTPATTGAMFSANEAARNVAKKAPLTKTEIRRALGPTANLSESDLAYAALGAAMGAND